MAVAVVVVVVAVVLVIVVVVVGSLQAALLSALVALIKIPEDQWRSQQIL